MPTVLITGGGTGIGRATALLFAERGAGVMVVGRRSGRRCTRPPTRALTRCVAGEYGWQGVRCNCIVPSWVETPMTQGFLADEGVRADVARRHALRVAIAEEVARTIVFLAGDDLAFVTGGIHAVDGGLTAL